MAYSETRAVDGVFYDEQSVTLHPVLGGNAETVTIDDSLFDLSNLVAVQAPRSRGGL